MKTITVLAWGLVAILLLHMVLAIAVWYYLDSDNSGLIAALFASNAGTAFLVGFVFHLPAFSHFIPRGSNIFPVFIGAASGFTSGVHWMADEVEDAWIRLIMLALIIIIVVILGWFIYKCNKERTKHGAE